jgi:hypothetical protein
VTPHVYYIVQKIVRYEIMLRTLTYIELINKKGQLNILIRVCIYKV